MTWRRRWAEWRLIRRVTRRRRHPGPWHVSMIGRDGWMAEATAINAWRHDRHGKVSLCPVCGRNDHKARIRTFRVTADEGRCAWGHVSAGRDIYMYNR